MCPFAEVVGAARHLAPDAPGLGPAHAGRGVPGFALGRGGGEHAVEGGHVVAVDAVLGLQLPVAVHYVGGAARHDFQPILRLIGQEVDPARCGSQMVLERGHIASQAPEHEPLIGVEGADPTEVEAFARAFRVARLLVLDADAASAAVVHPAVETAGEHIHRSPA